MPSDLPSADNPPNYTPISRAEYQAELKRTVYELPSEAKS